MCGVAGGTGITEEQAEAVCKSLHHRGPDAHGVTHDDGGHALAHTRLAIRDLDARSDQPFAYGGTTVAYNGELWNADQVRDTLTAVGRTFATTGDTEVVAAALDEWGVDGLARLDGMWVVAWLRDGVLRVAADRYGETPCHVAWHRGRLTFASELKALHELGTPAKAARPLGPGELVTSTQPGVRPTISRWHDHQFPPSTVDLDSAAGEVRRLLADAVRVRTVADVPVAALLSGGLDSAATLALLVTEMPDVVAYTAVHDPRSPDLAAARVVARHLDVPLVEVPVRAPTAADLAATVDAIEMPHKAQVEIGWACLALAEALSADGVKAVYSGEGSDELWASYGFSYHGIAKDGWYGHRRKLFLTQHRKNFARVNKVFLARGVEPRMPFLHDPLVWYALGLPQDAVRDGSRPKAVLERAVSDLLPRSIVRRAKMAFQDAAGLKAACARAVADPQGFYRAEYRARFT